MQQGFFEREYTCPVCKTIFKSLSVRSSAIYVEAKESDFHTIYKGINPLHYSIIVCPTCEYAASNTTFNQELAPKFAELLGIALFKLKGKESIDYSSNRDLPTTLKAFQLAIRSAQLKKVPAAELSGLLLAAAWIAREQVNKDLEKVYLEEALHQYVEAFNKGSGEIGNLSDLQATYLIGDLYRRNGEYREAINWFNKVISHKYIKNNPNIEKMAREGWALAKEESKNIKFDDEAEIPSANEEESPVIVENGEEQEQTISAPRRRATMQMPASLYPDQIDWLKKISNEGYKNTDKLFSREQVLRSALDFLIEELGEDIPIEFTNEEELVMEFRKKMATRN